jgi:hypothetical protein
MGITFKAAIETFANVSNVRIDPKAKMDELEPLNPAIFAYVCGQY